MKENTQEIKEKAEEDKKCLGYDHEAASQNIVNNALLLHIPKAFPKVSGIFSILILNFIYVCFPLESSEDNCYRQCITCDTFKQESQSSIAKFLSITIICRCI